MEVPPKVEELLAKISSLSTDERLALFSMLEQSEPADNNDEKRLSDARFANGRKCPHCGKEHVVKNGSSRGRRRYVCRDCGRSFCMKTGTALSWTHKDLSVWDKYVSCMIEGRSIRESAAICGICKKTSFTWRHKILDAMDGNIHQGIKLGGVVESDETFTDLSYKGNHKHSSRFTMPREAHKRGHEVHRAGLNHDKVCITVAVNGKGLSVAAPTNTAKPSSEEIKSFLGKHILEGSVLCTDSNRAYKKLVKEKNLDHVVFNVKKKEYTRGQYGVQRVNNYHNRLKQFLRRFNGVSSKYLSNYLVWNNFLNYAKESVGEKLRLIKNLVMTGTTPTRGYSLSHRPWQPVE